MSGVFEKVVLLARRTAQPYSIQVRTIISFLVVSALLLGILLLVRAGISTNAPTTYTGTIKGTRVQVYSAPTSWSESCGDNLIYNLAATLVAAACGGLLLLLLSPKASVEEDLGVVKPWQIREVLIAPLGDTKNYWFRGRSGRFLRGSVMPALNQAGSQDAQRRTLKMILPDPADDATLQSYADYRSSLAYDKKTWTLDLIRIEIIATILSAARYCSSNVFFQADIYLKSDFSLFRMDMSDEYMQSLGHSAPLRGRFLRTLAFGRPVRHARQ